MAGEESTEQPLVGIASDTVRVYDPRRGKVARVPSDQAAKLAQMGYATGDVESAQMAKDAGWGGAAITFGAGALSGATAGLSDAMMPKSIHDARERLRALHPGADTAGQMAGGVGMAAATGGLGVVGGIAARTAMGAVSGATEEYMRAIEHSEPIQAERILQRAGIGALINVGAEGLGAAIGVTGKAASKALGFADRVYRPGAKQIIDQASGKVGRQTLIQAKYEGEGSIFGKIFKAKALNALSGGLYGTALVGDAAIVTALNNTHAINNAITHYVNPAAKALGKAVTVLTETGAQMTGPESREGQREMYHQWRAHLEHAMVNPAVIENGVSQIADFSEHEVLRAGTIAKAMEQVTALHAALPKNPNDVLLGGPEWEPTDRQIKDFTDLAETVTNLPRAMENPTRGKILMAKMTNPEQFNLLQDSLLGHIMEKGTHGMSPKQMRACSLILGMPINQKTNGQFIAKMQVLNQTAGQPPAPGPSVGGGAKSKSTTLSATRTQQLDLGLE